MATYLLESHPELCFTALIGNTCKHPKKNQQGENERIGALREHMDISYLLYNNKYSVNQVRRDDIIDAAVLALTGLKASAIEDRRTIPENPETDHHGLKLQMIVAKRY